MNFDFGPGILGGLVIYTVACIIGWLNVEFFMWVFSNLRWGE